MNLSLFSVLDEYKLINILSYETTENLYNYSRHVDKRWQKAALIELFSRYQSRKDILNQVNLFQEGVVSSLKRDNNFIKVIAGQVLASMNAECSTPIHKLHGTFFLCNINEIPDGSIPDDTIMLFSYMSSRRDYYNPAYGQFLNDKHHNSTAFISVLSQTQIDRIVSTMTLRLSDDTQVEMALHALFILAPRIKLEQIEIFIPVVIQRLDDKCPNQDELKVLRVFAYKLKPEQIDIVITKILAKLDPTYSIGYPVSHLMSFASMANSTQAYAIFTKFLPMLNHFTNFKHMRDISIVCAHKFDKNQIEALIAAHTRPELKSESYPLFEILAPVLTSEQAYTKLLDYFAEHESSHHYSFRESKRLDVLISRLNQSHLQELIAVSLPQLARKIKIPITALIPQLTPPQINTTFITLCSVLNNHEASSYHKYVLQALTALVSQLTAPQVDTVFPKVISILGDKYYREDSTHKLTETNALAMLTGLLSKFKLDNDQINTLYDALKTFNLGIESDISDDLRRSLFHTITALAFRLDETRASELFIIVGRSPSKFQFDHDFIRLLALVALIDQLPLTHTQMNLFLRSFLDCMRSCDSSSHQKTACYNLLDKVASKWAPKSNQEQPAHVADVFDSLILIMETNPEFYDEASRASLAASTLLTVLVPELTQPQIEDYLVVENNRVGVKHLLIFKALASKLDEETQFPLVLTHVIAALDRAPSAGTHPDSVANRIYRLALYVLATFAPRLTADQAMIVRKKVIRHNNYTPNEALVLLNALLIANKLEWNTLNQEFEAEERELSPYLLEAMIMLGIMDMSRKNIIQQLGQINSSEKAPKL